MYQDLLSSFEAVRAALGAVSAQAGQAGALSGPQRAHVLSLFQAVSGAVAGARSAWIAADSRLRVPRDGDKGPAEGIAGRDGVGLPEARRQVRQAEAVEVVSSFAEAVAAGSRSEAHLDALAGVLAESSAKVRNEFGSPLVQAELTDLAGRVDPGTFRTKVRQKAAEIDPPAVESRFEAQRRGRHLHLSDTEMGTRIQGCLDPSAGVALRRALELTRQIPGEDRTPGQAQADALEALARGALAEKKGGVTGASVRPHLTLVTDLDTYTSIVDALCEHETARLDVDCVPKGDEHASAGASTDTHAASVGGGSASAVACTEDLPDVDVLGAALTGRTPVVDEDGHVLAATAVARTLCDVGTAALVIGPDGQPTDLGREERLFTGHQRRAVILRDQGCAFPGCETPARWSEVHHIRWWARDDGETSVDNGVVLCGRHHHEVHRADLTIRRLVNPHRRPRSGRVRATELQPARYEFRAPDGRIVGHQRSHVRPTLVAPPPVAGVLHVAASGDEEADLDGSWAPARAHAVG
ncbi:HNH endonuclease signature motif containing protein [Cellulomonas marina]|uniref:HNH nuclease domain-containing protein n=1 Tax=Cellulomonas marina TaxID=988821 RepID=A0A1I0X213_9CELL|nr:HNH endonuclease signature motif containing protein [Cellulomonas marina]SFA95052.1 protein of unknown function [Cellulomonas marina]